MTEITTLRELLSPSQNGGNVHYVGALFPRGYVSIIAGQPGCGKTWLELRYALDVAKGGLCIGEPVAHHEPGRVMILSGETSTEMLNHRAYLLGEIDRVNDIVIYSQQALSAKNIDMSLTTAFGRKLLQRMIDDEHPDIIFVDSLISFLSGDESSQADLSGSLVQLNNMAKHNDLAIVLIHHYRKRQQGASSARGMDDVIGSSVLTRLAGVVVGLEVDSQKSPPIVYAKCVKSWWKPFKTFSYAVCNRGNTEYVEIKQNYAVSHSGATSVLPVRRKIEDYILTLKEPFTQRKIMENVNVSQNIVSLTIGGMLERKLIAVIDQKGKERIYACVSDNVQNPQ